MEERRMLARIKASIPLGLHRQYKEGHVSVWTNQSGALGRDLILPFWIYRCKRCKY